MTIRIDMIPNIRLATVLSMLRILERKHVLTRVKEGRAHRYSARLTRDAVRQRAITALARKFFRGSTAALLVHLLEHDDSDDAEIGRLRAALRQTRGRAT